MGLEYRNDEQLDFVKMCFYTFWGQKSFALVIFQDPWKLSHDVRQPVVAGQQGLAIKHRGVMKLVAKSG